jgi:hypothetical protein
MKSRLKLSTAEAMDATGYRSAIGALRYLLHTRPDLALLVGYLSRFMEAPREDHHVAIKHVLLYEAGMQGHGLHYTKHEDGEPKLIGDIDTRKSMSDVIFFLSGNPIT